jgi:hypothetical protein
MGKKGKHTTVAKELKQTVVWLESLDEVKRVIIGISEACRHRYSPGSIRVKQVVLGGLSVNGYSGRGVTNLYLNIDPPDQINSIVKLIEIRYPPSF